MTVTNVALRCADDSGFRAEIVTVEAAVRNEHEHLALGGSAEEACARFAATTRANFADMEGSPEPSEEDLAPAGVVRIQGPRQAVADMLSALDWCGADGVYEQLGMPKQSPRHYAKCRDTPAPRPAPPEPTLEDKRRAALVWRIARIDGTALEALEALVNELEQAG